ncbi:MAG: ATP-binding domain-containing protein [Methanoregulaceae archaeon]|jgi:superfamily I DNA and RNA helicase
MHANYPDWDIAYIFFTQSVFGDISHNIERTLLGLGKAWDPDKFKIFHAWGSYSRQGLYRYICQANGVRPLGVSDVMPFKYAKGLAFSAKALLEQTEIDPLFDAILIDEGQDMVVKEPELHYQGKQPIYWMAYSALRPVHSEKPEMRRLIWAYDEYQNINTMEIPTAKAIFGEEKGLSRVLSGIYKGNIPKSIIMKESYRTPGPVILAAHALCMGMLNHEGMIAGPTQRAEWEMLGYHVNGAFQKNSMITLERPPKNSKNPLTHFLGMPPLFSFGLYATDEEVYETLSRTLYKLIKVDHIPPKNRILIVHLNNRYKMELLTKYLKEKAISYYFPGESDININHTPDYRDKKPRDFWKEGAVTIANANQAKGNEADFVFVIGLEDIAADAMNVQSRNALFVAMTRTKGWVSLLGTGNPLDPFYQEILQVWKMLKEDPFKITFQYRGKPKYPLDVELDEDQTRLNQSFEV